MIKAIREKYNREFTPEKYSAFLKDMNNFFNYNIDFRISETPVFVPKELGKRIEIAGEEIVDVILRSDFKKITEKAVPDHLKVPGENDHTHLLAVDFAICTNDKGEYVPQLIEMQGFASLYCYQEWLTMMYRKHFNIPEGFNNKFNNLSHEGYIKRLKQVIVGNQKEENVILLEIEPWKQKTQIDFYCTEHYLGIKAICLSDVIKEGRELFYMLNGKKTKIHRIYNRVIFDELLQRNDLKRQFNMTDDVDVEWVAHPNWFFRISKYTMPFIKSEYVPETWFVNELKTIPKDLENYVLKPLFSFSGQGVVFDVKEEDIYKVDDPTNYILQRKVTYAPAVESPTGPVKCEVRMLYLWDKGEARPQLTLNLGRMSKGKMIGVRYNQDLDWVGATSYFFEQ